MIAGRAALLAAGLAACQQVDVVATDDSRAAFCDRPGATLADGTCTGDLAARLFDQAVVACAGLGLARPLTVDGFDSRVAPWVAGGPGGNLVSAGAISLEQAHLTGDLTAGGPLEAGPTLIVDGDLAVAGRVGRPTSSLTVGGDARIGGDLVVGDLTVTGTLTTAPGTTQTGAVVAGSRATAPVTVAPPAACAADAVDLRAIVADLAADNHDDAVGLDPRATFDLSSATTLTLPCGRFFLQRIQGSASLVLRVTGKAVLAVADGITLGAELVIDLAPGAELDLFVTGPVNLPAAVRLGDPARPRALRIFVDAIGGLRLGPDAIAAGVYAPRADLTIGGGDLYGGLVVAALLPGAALAIHADQALGAAACSGP